MYLQLIPAKEGTVDASRKLAYTAGFIGAGILSFGLAITGNAYTGVNGEPYSIFNHLISELGVTNVSRFWWLFSFSLVVGGICFGLHMIGVGLQFNGWFRWLTMIGGALVGIFGALVGFFPLDKNVVVHSTVATIFFLSGMIVVTAFTIYVATSKQTAFPKWMAIPGIPVVLCAGGFLLATLVTVASGGDAINPPVSTRSSFEPIMASEWGVIIFLLVWGGLVSIHLARRQSQSARALNVSSGRTVVS
ncbi:MAG: DUF998 domain-containing protein [Chloroflexi bacterium]|nr:DUF998 domain-containing protein [Chloroflexota bacterium]